MCTEALDEVAPIKYIFSQYRKITLPFCTTLAHIAIPRPLGLKIG